ncbi:MAG TPA: toll/interleukin-1 receptor domain-containing protein [Rhodanobacter sp.]|nr:toll/interleukin-1 receptor domain-containing protein [Rhodanobacter sp.]
MARDVFVSYSQPDRERAFALVQKLEARGLSVWIAPRDVAPSTDWAAEIIDAISAARLMLLIFSASSNESDQVRREVERAVHKRLRILPFRIEDVQPSKSLEYFLSAQHWMDAFPPPLQPHVDRLCEYLEYALGQHAAAAPPVEPPPASGTTEAAPLPGVVDTLQLGRLETELTRHIGPVAAHLVRRAAKNGSDVRAIALLLAPEIDDEAQRHAFLDACQRIQSGK